MLKLKPGELKSTTVKRSNIGQGVLTDLELKFSIPGLLIDESTIKIGLPINQAVLTSDDVICKNGATNEVLTCTKSPDPTSDYNYLTLKEWK